MCHFVTAVLPDPAPLDVLQGIARLHGKQFAPLENASVQAQLKPTETYALATAGHCDCGTGLGALVRQGTRTHVPGAEDAARLRRKGWSETKISRSLEMKASRALAQHARRDEASLDNAQTWLAMLEQVFASTRVPYVCLLLHWYSAALGSRIQLQGRQVVPRARLTVDALASMNEDVLYEFRAV